MIKELRRKETTDRTGELRSEENDGSKLRIHKNRALSVITSSDIKVKSFSIMSKVFCQRLHWSKYWANDFLQSLKAFKSGHARTRKSNNTTGTNGAKLHRVAGLREGGRAIDKADSNQTEKSKHFGEIEARRTETNFAATVAKPRFLPSFLNVHASVKRGRSCLPDWMWMPN